MSKRGGQKPYGYYTPRGKDLTEKEIRVLDGIVADKTSYLISIEEDCDPANITRRLNSAQRKLGVRTRTGLVVKWDRLKRS